MGGYPPNPMTEPRFAILDPVEGQTFFQCLMEFLDPLPVRTVHMPLLRENMGEAIFDPHIARSMDGIVVSGKHLFPGTSEETAREIFGHPNLKARILQGRSLDGVPSVMWDNAGGIHEVMAHLCDVHGFRHFRFLAGPEKNEVAHLRLAAFEAFCKRRKLVHENRSAFTREWVGDDIHEKTSAWLDDGEPLEAIVTASDNLVLGVKAALKLRGRLDVAVTGFDDASTHLLRQHDITTIHRSDWFAAQATAKRMMEQMRGLSIPAQTYVPCSLVVRGSCGCSKVGPVFRPAAGGEYVFPKGDPRSVTAKSFLAQLATGTRAWQKTWERILADAVDSGKSLLPWVHLAHYAAAGRRGSWVERLREILDLARMQERIKQGDERFRHTENAVPRLRQIIMATTREEVIHGFKQLMDQFQIPRWVLHYSEDGKGLNPVASGGTTPLSPADFIDKEPGRRTAYLPLFFQRRRVGGISISEPWRMQYAFTDVSMVVAAALSGARLLAQHQAVQEALQEALELLERHNIHLQDLTERDELTRLLNRRGFLQKGRMAWARCRSQGQRALVLFADLDGLKGVNDRYGHEAGDVALQAAARCLQEALRTGDIVARLGGDEFTAIISDTEGQAFARVQDRLRDRVAQWNRDNPNYGWTLGISLGGCFDDPELYRDFESVVAAADKKLYEQKAEKKRRLAQGLDPTGN